MSASFSTWLSVGVGSRGTRRVDSTRALPCQEVSDADCRGNWKRPRLQAGEDLVNRGEQLPFCCPGLPLQSACTSTDHCKSCLSRLYSRTSATMGRNLVDYKWR